MVVVLVVGTIIGLIWADTSNVAGSIAVASNIVGVVGIIVLVTALAVVTRRQRTSTGARNDPNPDSEGTDLLGPEGPLGPTGGQVGSPQRF
jgi:hypothetical protein